MRETPQKILVLAHELCWSSKNLIYKGTIRREGVMENTTNPQRPDVEYPNELGHLTEVLTPDWVAGFVDGEGCFHIGINKNEKVKFGYQILPELTVVQHERDLKLLHKIRSFMGCGVVRRNHAERFCWRVRKLENLHKIILPFFGKYPLRSQKNIEFHKF